MAFHRSYPREKAIRRQALALARILDRAEGTAFFADHGLRSPMTAAEFARALPVLRHADLRPYFARVEAGESDVLTRGRPDYFATSSGTTAGKKLVPLLREQVEANVRLLSGAFFRTLWNERTLAPLAGSVLYLSSVEPEPGPGGVPTGYLSAISHLNVPRLLRPIRLPLPGTNRIRDFSERKRAIYAQLANRRLAMLSGTPPWLIDLLDGYAAHVGKPVHECLPALRCIGTGGTALAPYRAEFERRFPDRKLIFFEGFVASEGCIGARVGDGSDEFELFTHQDLYFEFRPAGGHEKLPLARVRAGEPYSLILTNLSGLWSYELGDVIEFTSVDPFRFRVLGRVEHTLNRFGEHLVVSQIEDAYSRTRAELGGLGDFCMAEGGGSYRAYVEAGPESPAPGTVANAFERHLRAANAMYDQAARGGVKLPVEVRPLAPGRLLEFMREQGRDPGQSKVSRILTAGQAARLESISPRDQSTEKTTKRDDRSFS